MKWDRATEQRLIQHAWNYGHFRNPDYPATHEVLEADLRKLELIHALAIHAMKSVQLSDCQCDDLCWMHHGRALEADGDVGPATVALIDIPRCGDPDFATDDDEYGVANAGRGAWMACDPKQEHHHEIVIKFDDRRAPAKWKGYMAQVKANAIKISRDMGLAPRYIDWDSDEGYQSSVIFKFISGGVIGYYFLPQESGCRRINQGALDTSYLPDVQNASGLWIHEGLGHGVGLRHRPAKRVDGVLRGIMNPSIVRVPLSWRGDPSEGDMRRVFGGVAIDPNGLPPPDEEPEVLHEWVAKEAGQRFVLSTGTKTNGGWEISRIPS